MSKLVDDMNNMSKSERDAFLERINSTPWQGWSNLDRSRFRVLWWWQYKLERDQAFRSDGLDRARLGIDGHKQHKQAVKWLNGWIRDQAGRN